jgi:hyperosmotically inducible protein
MKYIRNFAIITFAFLSVLAFDAKAQAPQTALEKQVFKELVKLPYYGVFDHIAYKVDGTTVTLFGKVANARNKKDAERWIKDIDGVETVVNRIEILPPSSSDNYIRQRILRTFADKGLYRYLWEPKPSVRIVVDRGRVELEGYVATKGDYNLMNILANGVDGVFSVRNNLVIERR